MQDLYQSPVRAPSRSEVLCVLWSRISTQINHTTPTFSYNHLHIHDHEIIAVSMIVAIFFEKQFNLAFTSTKNAKERGSSFFN